VRLHTIRIEVCTSIAIQARLGPVRGRRAKLAAQKLAQAFQIKKVVQPTSVSEVDVSTQQARKEKQPTSHAEVNRLRIPSRLDLDMPSLSACSLQVVEKFALALLFKHVRQHPARKGRAELAAQRLKSRSRLRTRKSTSAKPSANRVAVSGRRGRVQRCATHTHETSN